MATWIRPQHTTPLLILCQNALYILMAIDGVECSIGCFVCSSFNGSNPSCEDTFNSTVHQGTRTSSGNDNYQYPCWSFKKHRQGLFPADHCVKINGYKTEDSSQTMVIRTCALDSGTLTADTEIVRISHCGHFKFEGHQYAGCVQACDTDGCNLASTSYSLTAIVLPILLMVLSIISSELPRIKNAQSIVLSCLNAKLINFLWQSTKLKLFSPVVMRYNIMHSRPIR